MGFPSPVGDYDSSLMHEIGKSMMQMDGGFRPLSGIMILHNQKRSKRYFEALVLSFRPLSGIMILHTEHIAPYGR